MNNIKVGKNEEKSNSLFIDSVPFVSWRISVSFFRISLQEGASNWFLGHNDSKIAFNDVDIGDFGDCGDSIFLKLFFPQNF